jgi:hypothetical protein
MTTPEQAIAELTEVFRMIAEQYGEWNQTLPADTTKMVRAWRPRR